MSAEASLEVAAGMANSQLFNAKLLQDVSALGLYATILNGVTIQQQAMIDNQINARARMTNAASFDNTTAFNSGTADQSGQTQNQQPQSPIRTSTADAALAQPAGAVYPPIRNMDQGAATANDGIQAAMQSIADAMANLQAAVTAVITNAAGGASTPSQTTSKASS